VLELPAKVIRQTKCITIRKEINVLFAYVAITFPKHIHIHATINRKTIMKNKGILAEGVAQVVEGLPTECKDLSKNSSSTSNNNHNGT
jgi:hypothetical protein